MQQRRNLIWMIVPATVLFSLVIGAIAGALAGGVTAYLLARGQPTSSDLQARLERMEQDMQEIEARLEEAMRSGETRQGTPRTDLWEMLPEQLPETWPRIFPWATPGAVVREVLPGTPAEQAGLRAGDVIVAVEGRELGQGVTLSQVLQQYKPGDWVELTLERDNQEMRIRVQLGEDPSKEGRAYLGVRVLERGLLERISP